MELLTGFEIINKRIEAQTEEKHLYFIPGLFRNKYNLITISSISKIKIIF